MAPNVIRRMVGSLILGALWVAVPDLQEARAGDRPAASHAAAQDEPSEQDVLEVLLLLPGTPREWQFPGSMARSVSFQRRTMVDPTPTHTVVFETEARVEPVRAFYEAVIEKSGIESLEPPVRGGRIVLQFRGGSVLIGREGKVTFIVIVAEELPLAEAPSN